MEQYCVKCGRRLEEGELATSSGCMYCASSSDKSKDSE